MRLKLYRAADTAAAIVRVRAELGVDALILSSRRVAGGVEVAAALEQPEAPPPPPQPPPDAARVRALAWHGVPVGLAKKLLAGPLAFALAAVLRFEKLALQADAPPLLVIGPPGAGKTLTVTRLAARLVLAGTPPLVITADGKRAGATEELAAFTRLLGLHLLVASAPSALARALARRDAAAPVLVDTPGTDPFDPAQSDAIAALAATARATALVVLPAGLDAGEAADLAGAYAACGARLLAATRLDLARRVGGVLAATEQGLALAEAGVGPGAADGLVPMTPELLAARLQRVPAPQAARTGAPAP